MADSIVTPSPLPGADPELFQRFMAKVAVGSPDECWEWIGGKVEGYGAFYPNRENVGAHRISYLFFRGPIHNDLWVLHRCDNPPCVNPNHLFLGTRLDNIADMVAKGRQAKGDGSPSRLHPESRPRGDKHHSRVHPECMARGDANGARTHPENRQRGDVHWARLYPEKTARGEQNGAVKHPECMPRGEEHGNAKITAEQVLEIRRAAETGETQASIAGRFGISPAHVSQIVRRVVWRHV